VRREKRSPTKEEIRGGKDDFSVFTSCSVHGVKGLAKPGSI